MAEIVKPTTRLDRIEQVAKIAAAIAVPVILAAFGWVVQAQLARQAQSKEYVQLAVGILKEKKQEGDEPLRAWAVALLNANAPVKLDEEASRSLSRGDLMLPGAAIDPTQIEAFRLAEAFLASLDRNDYDGASSLGSGSYAALAPEALKDARRGLGRLVRRVAGPEPASTMGMGMLFGGGSLVYTFTSTFEGGVRKEVVSVFPSYYAGGAGMTKTTLWGYRVSTP